MCGIIHTEKAPSVALLAEGVDRNNLKRSEIKKAERSPSSRRAWIEILGAPTPSSAYRSVALLAEGVDRNILTYFQKVDKPGRPPRGGRG